MKFSTLAVAAAAATTEACTNILVSKGASADGSIQLAYNADSGALFGSLGHYPATQNNSADAMREVWDWDDSVYLGSIPEAAETYTVNGNMNEHGVMIGETTFGGLGDLNGHGTGAIVDYGSLIWITLQRAKTARQAIHIMDALVQAHGYASDGESFSVGDKVRVPMVAPAPASIVPA
jgi:dipeptidase